MIKYRGTQSQLNDEKIAAMEFMHAEIRKVMEDESAERREIVEEAFGNPTFYRQSIDRQYVRYRNSYSERPEWFYKWEIGLKFGHTATGERFVLRKDGTVNRENLKIAIMRWVRRRISNMVELEVSEHNQKLYEEAGSPGKDERHVKITLSKTAKGKARLILNEPNFKVQKDVAISEIAETIVQAKRLYEEWSTE